MNRREFVRGSVTGLSMVAGLAVDIRRGVADAVARVSSGQPRGARSVSALAEHQLFPTKLPDLEWREFPATGFAAPVCGVIFRSAKPTCCGVPLGGIGTGCLDIEVSGALGFKALFVRIPRKMQLLHPFLALGVSGRVWVLATESIVKGGKFETCTEPRVPKENRYKEVPPADPMGVGWAKEIHYFGHYPVVDMEYETDAPVSVGLRAWAPFVPGDAIVSNTPGAMFEVQLRNTTSSVQQGTIAFAFPGLTQEEAQFAANSPLRYTKPKYAYDSLWEPEVVGFTNPRHQLVQETDLNGVSVTSNTGAGYFLGVSGKEQARFGGGFTRKPLWDRPCWGDITSGLPPLSEEDFGATLAVDFDLSPGEKKTVRIVLAWYAPLWRGNSENCFVPMYTTRFKDATEVARLLSREHGLILRRTLAWQEAIYSAGELPIWLRDSLVNNFAAIAEDSYWAVAKPPVEWAGPEGLLGMNESPRSSPQIECIPCSWYGNFPLVFFFPELARTSLLGYKRYLGVDGAAPFIWGPAEDMATPYWQWQKTLNGLCFLDMIDRLWQRTADDSILKQFYDAAKKCNTYTMNLRSGPEGVISMPKGNAGMEWFEAGEWVGMCSHLGGLHLAQLRIMQRMAQHAGDEEYAKQCQAWLEEGMNAMETNMWTGTYYLNFYEKESGKKSDDVMAYQLDGEWVTHMHGLPGVFKADRVRTTLKTIKRCNIQLTPAVGAANFARPDGSPLQAKSPIAAYGVYSMFTPEVLILAMTYIYAGQEKFGLDLARRHWENNVCRQRHAWDLPNMVRGDTGERIFGTDYSQDMMLWSLPAAIMKTDLQGLCRKGGLVDRVIKAGKRT